MNIIVYIGATFSAHHTSRNQCDAFHLIHSLSYFFFIFKTFTPQKLIQESYNYSIMLKRFSFLVLSHV